MTKITKKFLKLFVFMFAAFIVVPYVNAQTYTNNNGVEMTPSQLEKLNSILDERDIENLPQENFDFIIANEWSTPEKEVKYIKTTTFLCWLYDVTACW